MWFEFLQLKLVFSWYVILLVSPDDQNVSAAGLREEDQERSHNGERYHIYQGIPTYLFERRSGFILRINEISESSGLHGFVLTYPGIGQREHT